MRDHRLMPALTQAHAQTCLKHSMQFYLGNSYSRFERHAFPFTKATTIHLSSFDQYSPGTIQVLLLKLLSQEGGTQDEGCVLLPFSLQITGNFQNILTVQPGNLGFKMSTTRTIISIRYPPKTWIKKACIYISYLS